MSDNQPFPWKHEVLRALIWTLIGSVATTVLNAVYQIRFPELGSLIDSLPVPLLIILTGAVIVLSFVIRIARLEQRHVRIITDGMLIAGLAGLSIAVVAALNIGAVPLGSFELTDENVYDVREVTVPRKLESATLKVSGDREPGFLIELERRSPGNGSIERLEIEGLEKSKTIELGRYYNLVRGEFTVPGPLKAGDTLYLHFENAPSFEWRLKLELTGSK
jgi:hypothetical protein